MADIETRLNSALEGRYAIERELGEGGMATVYLAHDARHDRKVAIKVLKPELAAVLGGERFLAEIRTTANLQHPHILPLHDSGEADGFLFYVMPFVEGESLRDRLDREKQLGVAESLTITRKVANALEYAHGHGVIHRDIKPANVLLSEQGEPLVADFGIALAVAQAGAGRVTETGLSLGTPHYMSPEQATGDRDVDRRSDVYALACVLYEMLAGEPPFVAPTAQGVLVRVLTTDAPPITTARRTVPPNVEAALAKALEKLPADRFESVQAFAAALEDERFTYRTRAQTGGTAVGGGRAGPAVAGAARTSAGAMGPPIVGRPWLMDPRSWVALAAIVVVGLVALLTRSPEPERNTVHLTLDLGGVVDDGSSDVVVAPDGSAFAFASASGDDPAIYARRADEDAFRRLPGTEDGRYPAFSPTEEGWLVFTDYSENALLKVSIDGGAPLTVLQPGFVEFPLYPHWGDEGTIVFSSSEGIFQVAATGGMPEQLLEGGLWAAFPRMLPGESGVLFTDSRSASVFVIDFAADTVREIIPEGIDASYIETGHIIYAHPGGGLFAAPFDLESLEVTGPSVPVLDDVAFSGTAARPRVRYSASSHGTLVYGTGGPTVGIAAGGQRLAVIDLEGNEEVLVLDPRNLGEVAWSPDGRSVVYQSTADGDPDPDIYTYNVELETAPRQLTFEGTNIRPVFSADGTRVAFGSRRDGTDDVDLFVKTLDDDSQASLLITLPGDQMPTDWPSDSIIVFEWGPNPSNLGFVNLADPDSVSAHLYLSSEADLDDVVVSRDGAWAAYGSDEWEDDEVYVRSFPNPGQALDVSGRGGAAAQYPFWSPDGNTVYYWQDSGAGRTFTAARIEWSPQPRVVSRDSLFWKDYDVSLSHLNWAGDRVIIPRPAVDGTGDAGQLIEPLRFVVVLNWFEELKQRLGER